ncbi:beta-glucosidase-like [Olea europaea subsp. europaea]|uniref:Beta-glucosidase-like n=1 Tax=Olea europaea subsp. europaea TaxID=158383 RepID=A0A8S0VNC7_OLEEU|nr:beta-glucosidase-like [Olea europaea subsp. europaea]
MDVQNNFLMITSTDESPVNGQVGNYTHSKITRSDFPPDFAFGAATSAYQIEGGWNAGSKGLSNWDVFTQKQPGGISDGSNGCVAIDHYNMFREDVALMKKMGGRLCTGVCKEGIQFYNDLIDALLAAGIEPYATIFHWDIPQCLEEEYGGFLNDQIVKDFCEFAEICFWEFGDRVKYWITLNEPWSYSVSGYAIGSFPPNRGKAPTTTGEAKKISILHRCVFRSHIARKYGDPGREPYIVAHNLIFLMLMRWIYIGENIRKVKEVR